MNVLHITDSNVFWGTEHAILSQAMALREAGVTAHIMAPLNSPLSRKLNDTDGCLLVPASAFKGAKIVMELANLLCNGRYQILHAHNGRTAFQAALAVCLAGKGRFAYTQHFLKPRHLQYTASKPIRRYVHRWVNRQASLIVAVSEAVRRSILARQDAPENRIVTIYPFLRNQPERQPPGAHNHSINTASNCEAVILVLSRLEKDRGVDLFIRAFSYLQIPAEAMIVGDGSERDSLKLLVRDLNLERRVRFAGYQSDPSRWLANADIVVSPCKSEAFGLAILEAMTAGKPVIAVDAGSAPELILDGVSGRLVPPNDHRAMAAVLDQLISSPSERCRLGANASKIASERFSAQEMVLRLKRAYELINTGSVLFQQTFVGKLIL